MREVRPVTIRRTALLLSPHRRADSEMLRHLRRSGFATLAAGPFESASFERGSGTDSIPHWIGREPSITGEAIRRLGRFLEEQRQTIDALILDIDLSRVEDTLRAALPWWRRSFYPGRRF